MPVGPQILWPVNASRSQPRAVTEVGSCGTPCDPSTTITAPTACAIAAISAIGLTVPSTLLTQVRETTLVRELTSPSRTAFSTSSRPSSVTSNHRNVAPVRSHASCHGTMLEWCSITDTTTSSPGPSFAVSVWAARLSASDAFFVNTTSSGRAAPRNPATIDRAPSNAAVASAPSTCIARATLALCSR